MDTTLASSLPGGQQARGRVWAASILAILLVGVVGGLPCPQGAVAVQEELPSLDAPPDGAAVSPLPEAAEGTEGQAVKLAAIAAAVERREWRALHRYLLDGDVAVQAAAVTALAAVAPPAIRELLVLLQPTAHPMRWQALGLLEQSLQADPEGGMAVLRALQADPPIGLALLRLALRGVSPDSTEVLPAVAAPPKAQAGAGESGSRTPDAQPGEWAAPAPAARGGETSTLRAALQAGDAAGQAAAFDAVAAQDPDTALRELVASLRDPTNPGRWQALQLLDRTLVGDDATVRTALIDTLQDPDPMLRESALQALARRAEPEGMGAVLQAFSDSDAATRVAVIDAIGPTEAGRQFLRGALSDADETVRTAAAARLREAEAVGQSD